MTKRIKALLYSLVVFFACLFGAVTIVFGNRLATADTPVVGNEYFYTTDSESTVSFGMPVPEYEEGKPYYEQGYSGVKVTFGKNGGTVYYGKEIDVRALTADRVLLELMPLTTVAGVLDYQRIEVVLTDVENPNIKLTYRFQSNPYYRANQQHNGRACYAKAGGQNQDLVGFELNGNVPFYGENLNGCPVYMSFEGTGKTINVLNSQTGEVEQRAGSAHKPLKIYFDYENQIAYATEGVRASKTIIADLKASYATAEWTGFQSNKVRMSITISKVVGNQSSLMLFNVMDNDFSGEKVQDYVKPEIYVDTLGYDTLPVGLVHQKYPVFKGELVDNFDEDIPFNPYVLYNGKEAVEIVDGYFYPEKVGVYSIFYEGKDSAGSFATPVRLDVQINANLPAFSYDIQGEMPTGGKVGQKITLPKGVANGGSGRLDVQTTIRYPDGTVQDVDEGFTPEKAGHYKYSVKITDFLGRQKTFVYWMEVETQQAPIVKIQSLPTTLVNGASYYMSSTGFEAYDYYSYGKKADAIKTLTLKDENGEVVETHQGEGFNFKADKAVFGEKLTMEWKAKSILYAYTTVETKEFTIVDVRTDNGIDMDKYFYQSDIESVVDNYQDGFNAVFLTTKEGAYVEYLLPVPESAVEISFDVPVEYNNFERLTVRLTDSWDASLYVDMTFMKNPKSTSKSFFTFGGEKTYEVNGCFRDETTSNGFVLYVSDGYVKDKLGTSIGKISQYANGKPFDKFPSGNVYVSVRIEDVGELETDEKVGVLISKICNQFVFDVPQDGIVPQIIQQGNIQKEAQLGEEVYVPFVRGFDVVSGATKAYLTITMPDKTTLCKNVVLTEDGFTFTAYQVGKYTVSFMTMDDNYNTRTQAVGVVVYDEVAPIVWLEKPIADTYAYGTRFQVPTVNVIDDSDESCSVMLLLVTPKGQTVYLKQTDTYVLAERGRYMLTVMVEDFHYNITTFKISFMVK